MTKDDAFARLAKSKFRSRFKKQRRLLESEGVASSSARFSIRTVRSPFSIFAVSLVGHDDVENDIIRSRQNLYHLLVKE